MKTMRVLMTGALAALALSLGTSSVLASEMGKKSEVRHIDFSKETPTATLTMQKKSIRLLVGGSWGSGVLNFRGKEHPFKIKGLSAGGVGVKEVEAVGDVYFLKNVEDLAGRYNAGTIGATLAKGGTVSTFENAKGVIISLKAKTTGLALSLGISSMTIEMQ